jgi:ribosome maturation factor RimP
MNTQKFEKLITPALSSLGFDCVRIQFSGGGGQAVRPALQVMAEPCEDREMTVEDCAEISRHLAAVLDVEDPIDQAYTLEISSPGIDRPLTRESDFIRFAGEQVKVTLLQMQDGQKRFKGRLTGIDERGIITIETRTGRVSLMLSDIDTAKLDPTEYYSMLKQQARRIKPGKQKTETT